MFEMPIERGKVREFARAMLSRNDEYQSENPTIPPTFLTTARMVWEPAEDAVAKDLGFDLRRVLHASEEFVFHGPPPMAGQTLVCSSHVGDRWEKEGRRGGKLKFAVLVTEFRTPEGVLVAEQRSTSVETSVPAKKADA